MKDRADTIAALATAPGLAGVAVIRLSGPNAAKIASELTSSPIAEPYRASLRAVRNRFGELLDRALVIYFRAPKSYTGEDVVEIQCHGGNVTTRRILEACFAAGARLARRGEFTERAFLNGKLDYDQAESVLDLVHAKTDRAAAFALTGLSGRKQRELKSLYDLALEISSILEHALDVSEEELPRSFYQLLEIKFATLSSQLESAIRSRKESRLLRDGALVVLAGAPNAGKSSLLNALLKENRAIVSATPGTTRDSIEAWMELDGFPVRLVDTAGLRTSSDAIESEGVRRSEELIAKADIVLYLKPSTSTSPSSNLPANPRTLTITSKCDLGRGEGLNVSARTGEGLDALKSALTAQLEALEPPLGDDALSMLIEVESLISSSLLMPSASISPDLVLEANQIRVIAEKLGSLIGATYSSDLLNQLFSSFCVGK